MISSHFDFKTFTSIAMVKQTSDYNQWNNIRTCIIICIALIFNTNGQQCHLIYMRINH